jgi:hypothetical protein
MWMGTVGQGKEAPHWPTTEGSVCKVIGAIAAEAAGA